MAGTLAGLTVGGLLDVSGDTPWSPIVGCVVAGSGAFYAASETTGQAQQLATNIFGKPTRAVGVSIRAGVLAKIESIKQNIDNRVKYMVQYVENIPNAISTAIKNKIQETVADIQAIPQSVKQSIDKKVQSTVQYVENIPNATSAAIDRSVEDAKLAAAKSIEDAKQAATKKGNVS